MVQIRERRILIDGKPRLLFAGEVHYYRLAKDEWEDRILMAKALGCNVIASYIPWLIHEPRSGEFDLTGRFRPENDVAAFIDLCAKHGLFFIARPGPFIMAEMKNEGIPYWVYRDIPDAVPITWEGAKATSKTLDYLEPEFLKAADRWYSQIMPILAERLQQKGGPIIGVQLDNEIGMLQWVTNQPDLSENVLCDFARWLTERYPADELKSRYPFDVNDPAPRTAAFREPSEKFAAAFHRDYGDFTKNRFARYVAALRSSAESYGVTDVPFIVNIHGTGSGRLYGFALGIYQLAEAYTQSSGYLSGSDHYLGELTRNNAQDLHLINAYMEASHLPDQPLTSMEFEVGTGDYGETGAVRQSGASADMKVRLSVAQGNRLLNYYLLAGGRNPLLLDPVGDGNDRVAFTGERHGFAAPIGPEGQLDPTYHALRDTTRTMNAVADLLADADEERDPVTLGFHLDAHKWDFFRPGPMERLKQAMDQARGHNEVLTRAMLFAGFRFSAHHLQRDPIDPGTVKLYAMAPARIMDAAEQRKLGEFVLSGGRLLLFGEFPVEDMEGRPCTVLAEMLGIIPDKRLEASGDYHLSLRGEGFADFEPETRIWTARTFRPEGVRTFLRVVGTREPCGVMVTAGKGTAAILPANYPCHMQLFRALFKELGVEPGLRWSARNEGVIVTSVRSGQRGRFITAINLDAEEKVLEIAETNQQVFQAPVRLPGRTSKLLPAGALVGGAWVTSTTELISVEPGRLVFRGSSSAETIGLGGVQAVRAVGGTVSSGGNGFFIRSLPHTETIEVTFDRP